MKISDHNITVASPHAKGYGNSAALIDTTTEAVSSDLSCKKGAAALQGVVKSEGGDNASVRGCNANNGNAGRTLNANNSATNGNDNYAGAFAGIDRRNMGKENSTSRPTRSNNETESRTATGVCGSRDYDFTQLPFWDSCGKVKAESGATICHETVPFDKKRENPIWRKLEQANKKRNLKGLSEFYESMVIAVYAVKRTCKDRDTKKKAEYYDRADVVAAWMIRQISRGTYRVVGYTEVDIPPRFPSGKHRVAKVFTLYDRCVQMFVLTIIEQKLRRKVLRNNYSNIEGRGIYCNDRRFCMINKIREATVKYPDDVVLLTDIRKFYDNVSWKVMCGVIFEIVKDKTSRWLITITLRAAGTLPIGSCISPLFADLLMNDYDETVLRDFRPDFYGAFGDNRCALTDPDTAVRMQQFTKSFYPGRYGVELKDDYQIKPVKAGFSFCRKQFDNGFVRERAEIRRRAIRVAHIPQSFAGYRGMFEKTDSRHLLYMLIYHLKDLKKMKDSRGMEISPFAGDPVDFSEFTDKRVAITNYRKVPNNKPSGYYYLFQIVEKMPDGTNRLCCSSNGCFQIKQAGDYFMRENKKIPIYVTVRKRGRSYYFEEYQINMKEACDQIVEQYNIKL